MATLTLTRDTDSAGLLRRINITLHGTVVARLRSGSRVTVDVEPGRHLVQACMDWTSSPEVEVIASDSSPASVDVAYRLSSLTAVFTKPGTAIEIRVRQGF